MSAVAQLFHDAHSPEAFIEGVCRHIAETVLRIEPSAVAGLISAIEEAAKGDHSVFLIGNGGSAAVASHFVSDMSVHGAAVGRRGMRVQALTDNISCITAIGNDYCFEDIFARQLEAQMRPGDLVIALSVSGNSPNILRAIEYANAHGGHTYSCAGFDGGQLKTLSQRCIHIESLRKEYGIVEDVFGAILHMVSRYIALKRAEQESST